MVVEVVGLYMTDKQASSTKAARQAAPSINRREGPRRGAEGVYSSDCVRPLSVPWRKALTTPGSVEGVMGVMPRPNPQINDDVSPRSRGGYTRSRSRSALWQAHPARRSACSSAAHGRSGRMCGTSMWCARRRARGKPDNTRAPGRRRTRDRRGSDSGGWVIHFPEVVCTARPAQPKAYDPRPPRGVLADGPSQALV